MNDEIILNKNIVQICYETADLNKKVSKVVKHIIQFYLKHFVGTRNTYIVMFLSNRIQKLYSCESNSHIYRKVLVEIYVFLGICNKPLNEKKGKTTRSKISEDNTEEVMLNELNTFRKENVIMGCVNALVKTKAPLLWQVIQNLSEFPEYIRELNHLYNYFENKELLFEAYRTIIVPQERYFYDNSEYTNLIFQCMLKVNYIYEEKELFDKQMEMYVACLNCPTDRLMPSVNLSIALNKPNLFQGEHKKLNIAGKQQTETMLFEKKMDNEIIINDLYKNGRH